MKVKYFYSFASSLGLCFGGLCGLDQKVEQELALEIENIQKEKYNLDIYFTNDKKVILLHAESFDSENQLVLLLSINENSLGNNKLIKLSDTEMTEEKVTEMIKEYIKKYSN